MKTFIATTDFSKTSINAVNYAADMAVATKTKLLLLNVVGVEEMSEIPVYPGQLNEDTHEYLKHKMKMLNSRLEKRTKNEIQIITKVIEGEINSTLQETIDNKKPFAVIVGHNRRNSLEDFISGSVAMHTAKHSHYPVLIIPEKARFKSISNIAYATDLYPKNPAVIIQTLKEWLDIFQAKLNVVNVNDNLDFKPQRTDDFISLKKHFDNYDVHFNYIVDESVPQGIFKYIKKNRPDMLALMYHKEKFLHRLVYRSNFKNIIKHSMTPVLVIPG